MVKRFESSFDEYTSTGVIGQGGAGIVHAVTNTQGTEFALKVLRRDSVNSDRLRRFKNEVGFCLRQTHRNIIRVIDHGFTFDDSSKCPFYVMPKYEGTLRAAIPSSDHLALISMFGAVLDGIEAAHLQDVWHRDLKPENVLLGPAPIVADFGIAHFAEPLLATAIETHDQVRLANFVYAAPEQRVRGAVDQRADIYALGLILNEMFTGHVPQGSNYPLIASLSKAYAYLDELVFEMIAQRQEDRPQSILQVKQRMSALGNSYIAAQEWNAKQGEIVRRHTPDLVQEPRIIGVDYENGQLILNFDVTPDRDWVETLTSGNYGHTSVHGIPAATFRFSKNQARVGTSEDNAQRVIDHFKEWMPIVTRMVAQRRGAEAKQVERREELALRQAQKAAEARANLLKHIKF